MCIRDSFSALVSLVKYAADPQDVLPSITFWLMGSLSGTTRASLAMGAPLIAAGMALIWLFRWKLNAMTVSYTHLDVYKRQGCAGRGIIAAMEKLKERRAFEIYQPDAVIYDVLGDVVCGGFAMPIREGYAEKVFVVTSGENMAIHAAANIAAAVANFRSRGYATLGGVILNRRNVPREEEKVAELAADVESRVVGALSFSPVVQQAEERCQTVLEAFPDSPMAEEYRELARRVFAACGE